MPAIRNARPAIIAAVIVALLLAGAGVVLSQEKDVSGTKHDVASPDIPPCVYCHVPRDPEGDLLWAGDPRGNDQLAGLQPLCFSCHDGTVTTVGSYAFDPSRPEHPRTPGVKGQDCDRCHDPHETGYGKFVKLPGGANLCQNCHAFAGAMNHPTDVDILATDVRPLDTHWDPGSGDFSGTRLWNLEGTALGTYVKCLTCHSPHGAQPNTAINTMPLSATDKSPPLCLNCHQGWPNQEGP